MRGGTQARLMRCDDHNFYVVKFQNSPQHLRVLANEWFGTKLADALGLPVPGCEVVNVDRAIVESEQLSMDVGPEKVPCKPGLQLGSRFVGAGRDPSTDGGRPFTEWFVWFTRDIALRRAR